MEDELRLAGYLVADGFAATDEDIAGSEHFFHFTEKRIEAHICICFMAYKVYKELERIIRIAKIDLSVDSVLRIAKTIATVRINLPNNGTVMQQTLLLTPDHCKIKPLFDIQSILSQG